MPGITGAHALLVSDTDAHRRAGVTRWVAGELAAGAKVIYSGRLPAGATSLEQHWLTGPTGPRGGREALATGQLQLLDIGAIIEHTGGRAVELLDLQAGAAVAALEQGWPRVAMSAESPQRAMREGEAAELATHERGLGELTGDLPLRALCQLAVPEEKDAAVWETVAAHHTDLVDEGWSATTVGRTWIPVGDLDAHVARRFGAGLHAALEETERATAPGVRPDLHVDLSHVTFLDVACARLLTLTARSAGRGAQVVLHRPSRTARRLVDAVDDSGRPRNLVWSDDAGPS